MPVHLATMNAAASPSALVRRSMRHNAGSCSAIPGLRKRRRVTGPVDVLLGGREDLDGEDERIAWQDARSGLTRGVTVG